MLKTIGLALGTLVLGVAGQEKGSGQVLVDTPVSFLVSGEYGQQKVEGSLSGYFEVTEEDLKIGRARVGGLNLVLRDVVEATVTGRQPSDCEPPVGKATFTVVSPREEQYFEIEDGRVLVGKVQGAAGLSQLSRLLVPPTKGEKEEGGEENDQDVVTQAATLHLAVVLSRSLEETREWGDKKVHTIEADVKEARVEVAANKLHLLQPYKLEVLEPFRLKLDVAWWRWEVAKRLCLQPVRIGRIVRQGWPLLFQIKYSGRGWNWGMPNARTLWNQADITFEERPFKTLWKSQYSTLTSSESGALRAEVDDEDCIEIFFVDKFSPQDQWGGGATWGGGSADAKVISTDENDNGVDATHLAHELSHVLTLKHPGSGFPTDASPHRVDGSPGTLACPSGFNNDNPAVQSDWNRIKAQNPLLKFYLRQRNNVDLCYHNDCGSC